MLLYLRSNSFLLSCSIIFPIYKLAKRSNYIMRKNKYKYNGENGSSSTIGNSQQRFMIVAKMKEYRKQLKTSATKVLPTTTEIIYNIHR